jgi:hypothetical protein
MRSFGAIGAAFLMACAAPMASHAGEPPQTAIGSGAIASSAAAQVGACDEPGPGYRTPPRRARHHAKPRKHRPAARLAAIAPQPLAAIPFYYNPGIPSPYDTAYDRAMVLHFRSPPVSGFYRPEPGFPPTPPVLGLHPYQIQTGQIQTGQIQTGQIQTGPVVLQYDGITGAYIQLAQDDPAHLRLIAVPPAPPPLPSQPWRPWRGERG